MVAKLELVQVPEFNGTLTPPATPVSLAKDLRRRFLALLWRQEVAAPEAPKADAPPDESVLVSAFIGRVTVDPVRGSRLVDVSFDSVDPKFAAKAANTLIEEYVDQNLQVKLQTSENMLDWLERELASQQTKVEESERALANYRDKQNALSLDDKQNIVLSRLNQLNDAVTKAKMARVQKETQYSQVKSLMPAVGVDAVPVDSIPLVAQNAQIQNLKGKLVELQHQKVQLSERYGEKHPALQNVNAQVQDTQRQLNLEVTKALQNVKNEYDTAVLEERTLSQNLEAAKADVQDLSRKSVGYNVMEREAKSNRQVYESLLQREKELRVSSNSRANNVRLVDRAEVPKVPLAPTGRRTWFMSFAIGLFAAIGVAFGLDYMNDTIKTPEDVTRRLKLPFLGLVPSVRGDKHPVLASSHVPHDFGEAFRSLRTSLMSRYRGRRHEDAARHERPAARGQDDDGVQHRDGAGVRRRARAAHRRRHAAAGTAPAAPVDQRARPLAGADRPGAGARRHSAHGRPEPARDHGGPHAAQSVRAPRVRTHEDAAQQPVARSVRLDRDRHAAGARRDRRRRSSHRWCLA